MDKLSEEELYDMTRGFLTESLTSKKKGRPDAVKKALGNLTEVAPAHAKIIEQYIRTLEEGKEND